MKEERTNNEGRIIHPSEVHPDLWKKYLIVFNIMLIILILLGPKVQPGVFVP